MAKTDPNEPITRGMLDEAVGAILDGMDKMFRMLRGDRDAGFKQVNACLEKVEEDIHGVKVELSHVKHEINGLKADISTIPSRREFEELKGRVDKRHPLS
jgi:archaellum component FlaC